MNPYESGAVIDMNMGHNSATTAPKAEPAHPTAGIWVPTELAERVQETMGEFLMDHGWRQQDMDTSDEFDALLAVATKAEPAPAAEVGWPLNELEELNLLNKLIELGARAANAHAASNSDDGHKGTAAYVQWQELRSQMGDLIRAAYAAPTTQAAPAVQHVGATRAAARALSDRVAEMCNVDKEDHWMHHSDDVLSDAELVISTYLAAQAQAMPAAVASPLTKLQRKAIAVCFTSDKVSVSEVQRKLSISYADAQTLCQSIVDLGLTDELELAPSLKRGAPAPHPAPVAQGDALPREEFAWMVVQEACETEPADEDDPECIRILRRDLKSAVLAAFLREDAARAQQEHKP